MTKRLFLILVSLLTTTPARTQPFRFRADVKPVSISGYYRISLPPDVVGRLNADLTDVRLYDDKSREVPYQLTRQQPAQSAQLIDFDLVSRTIRPQVNTTVVLRNRQQSLLRSISVQVKNADVDKVAQLSGSTDARIWYALRDAVVLRPSAAASQTTANLRIDMPTSDYEYYRLIINDSLSEPLNILGIRYDSTTIVPGTYTAVDDVSFGQRDSSDKKTYLRITRPRPARFDKLELDFSAERPFVRSAAVGEFRLRKHRRGRLERYVEVISRFRISSAGNHVVYLPGGLNTREVFVVIDNGDSPPLTVRAVHGFQISSFLTANLTAGVPYQLRFSADNVAAPRYDPADFRQLTNVASERIRITNIRPTDSPVGTTWGLTLPSWLIWVALGLVLALLAFFSVRMLREMSKPNT